MWKRHLGKAVTIWATLACRKTCREDKKWPNHDFIWARPIARTISQIYAIARPSVAVYARDQCCARRLTCSSNASRRRTRTDCTIEPRGQSSLPDSDGCATVAATRLTMCRDTLRESTRDDRMTVAIDHLEVGGAPQRAMARRFCLVG